MTCELSPIKTKFKIPEPRVYFSVSTEEYVKSISLDYLLGISDSVYNLYGYKTKIDNASYIAQIVYDLANKKPINLCVTDPKVMEERREFLSEEYVIKAMEGKLTSFDNSFRNILSVENFNNSDRVGGKFHWLKTYIAAFPKVYKETKERAYFNDVIQQISSKSEYYGDLKNRYNFKLKLISRRYIEDKATWVVNALHEEKDLITFFDSKKDITNVEVGNMFKVRGTVIKHDFSNYTKCKETRLSRIIFS